MKHVSYCLSSIVRLSSRRKYNQSNHSFVLYSFHTLSAFDGSSIDDQVFRRALIDLISIHSSILFLILSIFFHVYKATQPTKRTRIENEERTILLRIQQSNVLDTCIYTHQSQSHITTSRRLFCLYV
jgi:hypothetical protein